MSQTSLKKNSGNEEYNQKDKPPKYQGDLFDELAQNIAELFIKQIENEKKTKNKSPPDNSEK